MYLALYYNPMERPLGNILQTRGIFFKIWISVKIVYSGYSIPTELLIQLICLIITSYFNLLLSFLFCLFLSTSVSWFVISYHGYNKVAATAAAKSLQLCLTLWDPIDGSPPGSPIPGILQARTLEWVDISFSNAWRWKVKVKSLSCVWLLATPWTAAYQALPSMGFSRQEYWSGVALPSL